MIPIGAGRKLTMRRTLVGHAIIFIELNYVITFIALGPYNVSRVDSINPNLGIISLKTFL